jgi:hypothetical protein
VFLQAEALEIEMTLLRVNEPCVEAIHHWFKAVTFGLRSMGTGHGTGQILMHGSVAMRGKILDV